MYLVPWWPGGLVGLADPSAFHARVGVVVIHVSDRAAIPVTCVSERYIDVSGKRGAERRIRREQVYAKERSQQWRNKDNATF
jgi:hypothetical protein